jgi:hypothetical protein
VDAELQYLRGRCLVVTAIVENGVLRLDLSPLHKVLALKGSLQIPLTAIESVEIDGETAHAGPQGTRNPGTNIPHLINAGSFNSAVNRTFWDVHNPDNAIVIKLRSGMFAGMEDRYDEVIVEVANPAETIVEINWALGNSEGF